MPDNYLTRGLPALPGQRQCDHESCDRRHYAKGWCHNHYIQWRYRTDPAYRERVTARRRDRAKRRRAAHLELQQAS